MSRIITLAVLMGVLAGCSQSALPEMSAENEAVLEAVFASQPDVPAQLSAMRGSEESVIEALYDERLCVAPSLAGTVGNWDRMREGRALPDGGSSIWGAAKSRTAIPSALLPGHLRWDGPLRACINGVLQFSEPEISGNQARIFAESKCDGWCSWGGVIHLERHGTGWTVTKTDAWWMS